MLDQMKFNVKKVGSTVDILDQNGISMNITNEQLTLILTENLETNSRYVIEGNFLRNFLTMTSFFFIETNRALHHGRPRQDIYPNVFYGHS